MGFLAMGRMGRLAAGLWGMLAVLVVAACVPTSEHPIRSGPPADKDIVGTWHGTLEDGAAIYLHILRRTDDQLGAILVIGSDEAESRDEWAAFRIVTAKVGEQRYMSALWDLNDGEPVKGREIGYHLLRYALEPDGSLAIHSVNEEKLLAAVRDGLLDGKIDKTDWNEEVRVTASSEQLAAYLQTIDPAVLFDHPFAKLKLAKDQTAE